VYSVRVAHSLPAAALVVVLMVLAICCQTSADTFPPFTNVPATEAVDRPRTGPVPKAGLADLRRGLPESPEPMLRQCVLYSTYSTATLP
jgi:hypothetical protein